MKVILLAAGFLFGLLFAAIAIYLVNLSGFTPDFPAFAGEEDFSLRFVWLFFVVFPSFACLGTWFAWLRLKSSANIFVAFVGAFSGIIAHICLMLAFSPLAGVLLTSRNKSNLAAVLSLLSLPALSWVGAYLAHTIYQKRRANHGARVA